VTPSIYGTDNSATLYGMQARGRDARGVAVIDEATSDAELKRLNAAGIRGVRLNFATASIDDPSIGRKRFEWATTRVNPLAWHVQINTTPPMISALKDLVMASPVPVVFDHFGGAVASRGVAQPGFADLLSLVQSGKAYVKISAAYRASTRTDYADVEPLARALISANKERVLWGTDWPHPNPTPPPGGKAADVTPLLEIDDGRVFNLLPQWTPDAAVRRTILVDNPNRVYGF
jgi:predicted TIM-barrel fold metal-dependent hydrolase